MSVASRLNAPHYTWGDGCDGWHLVRDTAVSVIHEVMPPGTSEIPHLHSRARQFFYVLSGLATMQMQNELIDVRAGEGIEVEPGLTHQMRNQDERPLEFLVISVPPSAGNRETAV